MNLDLLEGWAMMMEVSEAAGAVGAAVGMTDEASEGGT